MYKAIQEEMKKQGISQIELALRLGVTRQTIYNYLTGRNDIGSLKFILLLDVLGYAIVNKAEWVVLNQEK